MDHSIGGSVVFIELIAKRAESKCELEQEASAWYRSIETEVANEQVYVYRNIQLEETWEKERSRTSTYL